MAGVLSKSARWSCCPAWCRSPYVPSARTTEGSPSSGIASVSQKFRPERRAALRSAGSSAAVVGAAEDARSSALSSITSGPFVSGTVQWWQDGWCHRSEGKRGAGPARALGHR